MMRLAVLLFALTAVPVILAGEKVPDKTTDASKSFKKNTVQLLCDDACENARTEAAEAAYQCRAAQRACATAKESERNTCVNGCKLTAARNAAECTNTDPDPACYVGARAIGSECESSCRSASYNPAECGAVKEPCDKSTEVQASTKETCKCAS